MNEAPDVLKNWLPCEVSGGVHWFVNKAPDGCLLVMFNNIGIFRSVEKGEYILPEGTRKAKARSTQDLTSYPAAEQPCIFHTVCHRADFASVLRCLKTAR